ncbi:MAG: hypothetical protein K0Q57_140 [Gammaproteobacteria bacterium]|jgi:uncharacterized protein YcfL|nr:hypothetical protein [Gammaproteobacteria bacterium]
MMKRILLLAVAALGLAGCAHNCVVIPSSSNNSARVGSGFDSIVGVTTSTSKLAGDMVVGKVQLVNNTSVNQQVQYKFDWFSQDGFNLGQSTPWQPVSLYPNMSKVVSAVAPSGEATNFNISVCQMN